MLTGSTKSPTVPCPMKGTPPIHLGTSQDPQQEDHAPLGHGASRLHGSITGPGREDDVQRVETDDPNEQMISCPSSMVSSR